MNIAKIDSSAASHFDTLQSYYAAEQRYVMAGGAKANADFSEVAAHFHPDATAHQGPDVPFPGEWKGVDAIQKFFEVFTDTWSTLKLTNIAYFAGETGVTATMRMQATARNTGKVLDTKVAHVYTIQDGLIRHIDVFYHDPVQAKAVTLP